MPLADRQGRALVAGAQPPAPPQKAALDLHSIPLPLARGWAGHRDGPSRISGWQPAPAKCNLGACILAQPRAKRPWPMIYLRASRSPTSASSGLSAPRAAGDGVRGVPRGGRPRVAPAGAVGCENGGRRPPARPGGDAGRRAHRGGDPGHPAPGGVDARGCARRRAARGGPECAFALGGRATKRGLELDHRRAGGADRGSRRRYAA